MKHPHHALRQAAAAAPVLVLASLACAPEPLIPAHGSEPPGVVIEEVPEWSALAKAGLRPGDVVTHWERLPNPPANPEGASGEIRSVFDWEWVKVEQVPRGAMRLTGFQDGREAEVEIPPGRWRGEVRPRLSERALQLLSQGRNEIAAHRVAEGTGILNRLADDEQRAGHGDVASWLRLEVGEALRTASVWDEAERVVRNAREEAESSAARLAAEEALGGILIATRALDEAEESRRVAVALVKDARATSLGHANHLVALARLLAYREQLDEAQDVYLSALRLYQAQAPESLALAATLTNLGVLHSHRGALNQAGDLHSRALEIYRKQAPGDPNFGSILNNTANVEKERGNLESAHRLYAEALELNRVADPGSPRVASNLTNLAGLAAERGALDEANAFLGEALDLWRRHDPEGGTMAVTLETLGIVAALRGKLDESRDHLEASLAIRRKTTPESIPVAEALGNLGELFELQEDRAAAEAVFLEAKPLWEKHSPRSLGMAGNLAARAGLLVSRRSLEGARSLYKRCVELARELAPASRQEAECLHALANIARQQNLPEDSERFFEESLAALEGQIGKLGGSKLTQARYRSRFRHFYSDYIDLLLELGRPEEAFYLLERSRQSVLRSILKGRQLAFQEPEIASLLEERARLAINHDRALEALVGSNPSVLTAAKQEVLEARKRYAEVSSEIHRRSPRIASLESSTPLGIEEAQKALAPGTLMLSYQVGEDLSNLFILNQGDLSWETISDGARELGILVGRLRNAIQELRAQDAAILARRLFDLLMAPAATQIDDSERVLIIPDGPLHLLPWAVLMPDSNSDGVPSGLEYLIQWKPLHYVSSATVYAELQGSPPGGSKHSLPLVAFGDPDYSAGTLPPIPASRREVRAIAALHERSAAYLGPKASEENAKIAPRYARTVHFAVHGILDGERPLHSYLALSSPGEPDAAVEDGKLFSWEIFGDLRLEADLVVLSACDSSVGEEIAGEGLLGLARAFQFAGARSLLASLWKVEDAATSRLLVQFYRQLRTGMPLDVALQRAQKEEINGPGGQELGARTSPQLQWAAFQVFGPWSNPLPRQSPSTEVAK